MPVASVDIVARRDQAYHRLRQLLITQSVPEGKQLRELEWAEQLGVNRAALREALARLEAEGLIEKGHRPGYFVPSYSSEDLQEIVESRLILEIGAIDRINRLGLNQPRHFKPMREACDQMEHLIKSRYPMGVMEADRRFHQELVNLAGNRRLTLIYMRAPLPNIRPEVVDEPTWTRVATEIVAEHRAILGAIFEEQPDRARQLLVDHLRKHWVPPLWAA